MENEVEAQEIFEMENKDPIGKNSKIYATVSEMFHAGDAFENLQTTINGYGEDLRKQIDALPDGHSFKSDDTKKRNRALTAFFQHVHMTRKEEFMKIYLQSNKKTNSRNEGKKKSDWVDITDEERRAWNSCRKLRDTKIKKIMDALNRAQRLATGSVLNSLDPQETNQDQQKSRKRLAGTLLNAEEVARIENINITKKIRHISKLMETLDNDQEWRKLMEVVQVHHKKRSDIALRKTIENSAINSENLIEDQNSGMVHESHKGDDENTFSADIDN